MHPPQLHRSCRIAIRLAIVRASALFTNNNLVKIPRSPLCHSRNFLGDKPPVIIIVPLDIFLMSRIGIDRGDEMHVLSNHSLLLG